MNEPFAHDADLNDPLAKLRIAVTDRFPSWSYLVAFDHESEARPNEAEERMLGSFLAEIKSRFYESYVTKMEQRPLDVDAGANTIIFHKYADGDWGFRRRTWTGGFFVPLHPRIRETHADSDEDRDPHTLEQVMDRARSIVRGELSSSWSRWKAEHPDAFAPVEHPGPEVERGAPR